MSPGAQSLVRVQVLEPHKPPVQAFPQPSKQFLLHVETQGTEAPDEPLPVAVVPELAVAPALVIVPALPRAVPEPLPAAMPDPAARPPLLVLAFVPLSRPPQPRAAAATIIEIMSAVRGIGVPSAGARVVIIAYTQIARQMRLQLAGMGTMALSQSGPASGPEQSNRSPGDGDTHDGVGTGGKQPLEASEYSVPSGHSS